MSGRDNELAQLKVDGCWCGGGRSAGDDHIHRRADVDSGSGCRTLANHVAGSTVLLEAGSLCQAPSPHW